jgi:hypothetical protein
VRVGCSDRGLLLSSCPGGSETTAADIANHLVLAYRMIGEMMRSLPREGSELFSAELASQNVAMALVSMEECSIFSGEIAAWKRGDRPPAPSDSSGSGA